MKYIYYIINNEKISGEWNEKSYKTYYEGYVRIYVNNKEYTISDKELNYLKNNNFNSNKSNKPAKKTGLYKFKPVSLTRLIK